MIDDDDEWVAVTRTSPLPEDNNFINDLCEEDWDEEIAMYEMYCKVKDTCKERETKTSTVIDAFQSSINRYPPSLQAYSATANYYSFVYKNVKQEQHQPSTQSRTCFSNNVQNEVWAVIEGQFDDAE